MHAHHIVRSRKVALLDQIAQIPAGQRIDPFQMTGAFGHGQRLARGRQALVEPVRPVARRHDGCERAKKRCRLVELTRQRHRALACRLGIRLPIAEHAGTAQRRQQLDLDACVQRHAKL